MKCRDGVKSWPFQRWCSGMRHANSASPERDGSVPPAAAAPGAAAGSQLQRTVAGRPQNLDLSAKEVLLNALRNYTGTLVLVAHDRYLLAELPDEVTEAGSGHATRYLGHYEAYLRPQAAGATGRPPAETTAEPPRRTGDGARGAAKSTRPSNARWSTRRSSR